MQNLVLSSSAHFTGTLLGKVDRLTRSRFSVCFHFGLKTHMRRLLSNHHQGNQIQHFNNNHYYSKVRVAFPLLPKALAIAVSTLVIKSIPEILRKGGTNAYCF